MTYKGPRHLEYTSQQGTRQLIKGKNSHTISYGEKDLTTIKGGKVWPLKVGATWTHTWRSVSSRERSTTTDKCKVKKQVKLNTAAGIFQTHMVTCTSQWHARTKPYRQIIWYDVETNMMVQKRQRWDGGGNKTLLVSVKR
ncbi:hypothetical protein [Amylibacter sp. IMCC11727]|uniref:hypothetical protein n=1 Tax=Amylibacter sp. IMCC11727 TaxID=3039851 RepID=UPI00244E3E17|nr:hypothetical protein [Amylibacter sp. IMCC11727]WGI22143.1 hypothetical protein QBD29_01615 [Amylibacter sp. IMCC11727]